MDNILERFFRYISIDTQSDPAAERVPSTDGQLNLARALFKELTELGFEEITLNDKGCVMATLPSNVNWPVPVIGFIAHLDTAPDCSGKGIKPQVVENYRGGDVKLGMSGEVLSPTRFPVLNTLIGHTLITTDGTTLLGSDDKSGITEIITAMLRLREMNRPHGSIRFAFSPDEEIGKGAQHFDVEAFGAEWAYTVDGGGVGELEAENFNAASANIKIFGNNVHPGSAKDVMVNALTLATRIHQMLPTEETPEHTEGYQGFFHLISLSGAVEQAEMNYIIRDFDRDNFAARKARIQQIARDVQAGLPSDCRIEVTLKDSYSNMRDEVAKFPHVVEIARQAMVDVGVEPEMCPIRGGTDGAQLSFRGLPCPNLFTGGYNFHGKHEFVTLQGMEKAVSVIMRIAERTADRAR
ncbi:peptidase T [Paludibacterium purpuratum]|uniref:Peptidase T n=1 Tax=Paludibacterium purpuratum TaxID=1144873 RepID=A0A4R7AWV1_9NEIS|nr:peptidase T [Paludibacterium purpuratum]TDR72010.1 tripeptide aminopeptidase [Paludibacterium purpuratum]